MKQTDVRMTHGIVFIGALFFFSAISGCADNAPTRYWGRVAPPSDNILRYVTGSEPESLDPGWGGQPESRILIGLYDRLVEVEPRSMEPIPSLATHWEIDESGTVYTFYLRKNAKFSNGDPITAEDFVWSSQRLIDPALASRYGYFGYDIKYAEAISTGGAFVRKDGGFLAAESQGEAGSVLSSCTQEGPTCLTVPSDPGSRAEMFKSDPALEQRIADAEFVPVQPSDLGVVALDEHTLRITLIRPAPYFLSLLAAQYFSVLHRPSIEKHGTEWMRPENIVTSGTFKVASWKPYDELFLVKNPYYWDAANVKLDGVRFYPLEEVTTMMNLYKSGRVDAIYNHTVPSAWFEYISQFRDEYLLHPEMSNSFYGLSVKKPPVDKVEVRKALSLAIDRKALAGYMKTQQSLTSFIPEGVFPEYDKVKARVFAELAKRDGVSGEDWKLRDFDPGRACSYMEQAGYTVVAVPEGKCRVEDFPAGDVSITYNTKEEHKQVAEFVQAQWKQNLGIEIQIKNLEWKTYLEHRAKVQYKGVIRAGWVGDYIDPYTYSQFFYSTRNDSGTGWWSAEYDRLIRKANSTREPERRLELLAEAEYLAIADQPVIPLGTMLSNWMKKPYVKGMYPNPGTLHSWKFIWIEEDPARWDRNVADIMTAPQEPSVAAQVAKLRESQEAFERARASAAAN